MDRLLLFIGGEKLDPSLVVPPAPAPVEEEEPEPAEEPIPDSADDMAREREKKERKWKMRDRSANWRANYVSARIFLIKIYGLLLSSLLLSGRISSAVGSCRDMPAQLC